MEMAAVPNVKLRIVSSVITIKYLLFVHLML